MNFGELFRIPVLDMFEHLEIDLHAAVEGKIRRRSRIAVSHADMSQFRSDHDAVLFPGGQQRLLQCLKKRLDLCAYVRIAQAVR